MKALTRPRSRRERLAVAMHAANGKRYKDPRKWDDEPDWSQEYYFRHADTALRWFASERRRGRRRR